MRAGVPGPLPSGEYRTAPLSRGIRGDPFPAGAAVIRAAVAGPPAVTRRSSRQALRGAMGAMGAMGAEKRLQDPFHAD